MKNYEKLKKKQKLKNYVGVDVLKPENRNNPSTGTNIHSHLYTISTVKSVNTYSTRFIHLLTFPMKLQGAQQADRLEHLSDVHLQTALQLDEEPTDLRVDLSVLGPEVAHSRNAVTLLASWNLMTFRYNDQLHGHNFKLW